jgi:hypothetical protein
VHDRQTERIFFKVRILSPKFERKQEQKPKSSTPKISNINGPAEDTGMNFTSVNSLVEK